MPRHGETDVLFLSVDVITCTNFRGLRIEGTLGVCDLLVSVPDTRRQYANRWLQER